MVLGRKEIAPETDRLNLGLRRQPSAAEAVDANRRAGPAHLFQRRFHVVRIVGQGVDLLAGEQVPERIAARIERAVARILADHHVFGDLGEVELHLAPRVAAGAQTQVVDLPRFETGELGPDRVPAGRERRGHRLTALVGHDLDGLARRLDRHDRDLAVDDDGAGLVDDRDAQGCVASGLRQRGLSAKRQQQTRERSPRHRASLAP